MSCRMLGFVLLAIPCAAHEYTLDELNSATAIYRTYDSEYCDGSPIETNTLTAGSCMYLSEKAKERIGVPADSKFAFGGRYKSSIKVRTCLSTSMKDCEDGLKSSKLKEGCAEGYFHAETCTDAGGGYFTTITIVVDDGYKVGLFFLGLFVFGMPVPLAWRLKLGALWTTGSDRARWALRGGTWLGLFLLGVFIGAGTGWAMVAWGTITGMLLVPLGFAGYLAYQTQRDGKPLTLVNVLGPLGYGQHTRSRTNPLAAADHSVTVPALPPVFASDGAAADRGIGQTPVPSPMFASQPPVPMFDPQTGQPIGQSSLVAPVAAEAQPTSSTM